MQVPQVLEIGWDGREAPGVERLSVKEDGWRKFQLSGVEVVKNILPTLGTDGSAPTNHPSCLAPLPPSGSSAGFDLQK